MYHQPEKNRLSSIYFFFSVCRMFVVAAMSTMIRRKKKVNSKIVNFHVCRVFEYIYIYI